MFYSYACPAPQRLAGRSAAPRGGAFDQTLGEFLLPNEAVRRRTDPEEASIRFLQSSYEAAAQTAGRD